jgi:deltex-like protein
MPGQPYYAIGFPRNAFLPDTDKGRKALSLLEKAFNRRLTFTISKDSITGQHDLLTWNSMIEHKTEFSSTSENGFPDPDYLDRVLQQLSMVVEEQDTDV